MENVFITLNVEVEQLNDLKDLFYGDDEFIVTQVNADMTDALAACSEKYQITFASFLLIHFLRCLVLSRCRAWQINPCTLLERILGEAAAIETRGWAASAPTIHFALLFAGAPSDFFQGAGSGSFAGFGQLHGVRFGFLVGLNDTVFRRFGGLLRRTHGT